MSRTQKTFAIPGAVPNTSQTNLDNYIDADVVNSMHTQQLLSVPEIDGPTISNPWHLESINIPIAIIAAGGAGAVPTQVTASLTVLLDGVPILFAQGTLSLSPIFATNGYVNWFVSQQFYKPVVMYPGQKITFHVNVSSNSASHAGPTAFSFGAMVTLLPGPSIETPSQSGTITYSSR